MELIFILSVLISIFSLALVLIGIPAQIVKNYREKRSGQPLTTILIALFVVVRLSNKFLPNFIIG